MSLIHVMLIAFTAVFAVAAVVRAVELARDEKAVSRFLLFAAWLLATIAIYVATHAS